MSGFDVKEFSAAPASFFDRAWFLCLFRNMLNRATSLFTGVATSKDLQGHGRPSRTTLFAGL